MIYEVSIGLAISYSLLFILSIILKDNSIADIFWGLGFLQISLHSIILSDARNMYSWIIFSLVSLWSLRIASYIFLKKRSKGEDKRYAKWREEWKYFYSRSFFQIYLLQGLLMLLISTPLFIIFGSTIVLDGFFIAGIVLALCGLIFETIADIQLYSFVRTKRKGEIMKRGLWYYSRHPNYFGESVFWLGISIIGLSYSYVSIIGFVTITVLLRYVSGVPMAEARYDDNKEYQEYKRTTPPMIPDFFK